MEIREIYRMGLLGLGIVVAAGLFFSTYRVHKIYKINKEIYEKDFLATLFPDFEINERENTIRPSSYLIELTVPPAFPERYPDAENTIRTYLLENYPYLKKVKLSIKFIIEEPDTEEKA